VIIKANTHLRTLGECAAVVMTRPQTYNESGAIVFTMSIAERMYEVRDYGYQVRVEPLPELGNGVRIGVASRRDRDVDYDTAVVWALSIMEAAGILRHTKNGRHDNTGMDGRH